MTLPSGADIALVGENYTYEFMLAQDVQGHYRFRWLPRHANESQIQGSPGKQQTRPDRIVWSLDDFIGGSGARVWSIDEPDVYRLATANTRIPGQFSGRPTRAIVSTLTANDISDEPRMAIGDGALWYGGGYRVGFTSDGTSWTVVDSGARTGIDNLNTNYTITAMTGDSEYVYYSAWRSTARVTLRKKADNTNNAEVLKEITTGTPDPFAGLSFVGGKLYGWTGRILREMRVNGSGVALPLTDDYNQKVYNSGTEVASAKSLGTQWWADSVGTENAVFMFHAVPGSTTLHMFNELESGRQIWTAPYGFTAKSISYNAGVVFLAGNYVGSSNTGWGCVYAIPVQTLQPIFLGWFMKHLGMKNKDFVSEGSYGNTVMFGDQNRGMIWIYDMDADGISILDYIATSGAISGDLQPQLPTDALSFTVGTHRIGDLATFGDQRYALLYNTSGGAGNYVVAYWQSDEESDRQIGTSTNDSKVVWESPRYDLGYPLDQKSVDTVTVVVEVEDGATNSGMKVGQSVLVEMKGDGTAWQTLSTITSATNSSGDTGLGRFSIAPASQGQMFTSCKFRITLTGGYNGGSNPVAPPIVRSVNVSVAINNYDRIVDLVLRARKESTHTARPISRSRDQYEMRTQLKTAVNLRTPLTLRDGAVSSSPGIYDTYTVIPEGAEDVIERNAEGTFAISLKILEGTAG